MADQSNITPNIQFSIGKSYGLANTPRAIPDYQQKFENIRIELKKAIDSETEEMKKSAATLSIEFEKTQDKILSSQSQISEKLEKMLEKIDKHDEESSAKDSKFKEMRDEVLKLANESFKQNMKVLTVSEQALIGRIGEFSNNLVLSMERVEKKRTEFIEQLGKDKLDITEFEKGYLHGDSLRVALGDNSEANNK